MRFVGEISTNKVGSECEFEFEIDDEELAGLTDEARQELIENEAREVAFENIDWWFKPVDDA